MRRSQIDTAVWDASFKANENNDCTVKAVTIATGIDYDTVHAAFAKAGRKNRKGVNRSITKAATESLGYILEPVEFSGRTAITIERDRRLQSGRYVVGMTSHLAAMIDGKLIDHTAGRRKKVNAVFAVTKFDGYSGATKPATKARKNPAGTAKWQSFAKYTKHDQIKLI